jgi:hypothetical protein
MLTSRVITTLLTALAAFVGLVYLLGAGVLWIRLAREGLPTEAVITSLPRELLLSVGLRSILLPALVYSGLGVLVLILVEWRTPIGKDPGFFGGFGEALMRLRLLAFVSAGSLVGLIIAGVAAVVLSRIGFGVAPALGWLLGGLVVILVSAAIAMRRNWKGGWEPETLRVFVGIALLAAGVATLARLSVEIASPQFEQISVCARNPDGVFQGLFIGETGNGVYLGDVGRESVVEIPRDRLKTVWFGLKQQVPPPP